MATFLSRRIVLSGLGGTFASRALPVAIGVSYPVSSNAAIPEAGAVLGLINALRPFFQSANGDAERFAVLDLKLDAILDNQEAIMSGLQEIQSSIKDLARKFPDFIQNEAYRKLLETSDRLAGKMQTLAQRLSPIEDKEPEFSKLFDDLEKHIGVIASRFKTTTLGIEGVGAMVHGAVALRIATQVLHQAANFELNLPESLRWEKQRDFRYLEACTVLQQAAVTLATKRIPEIFNANRQELEGALASLPRSQRQIASRIQEHANGLTFTPNTDIKLERDIEYASVKFRQMTAPVMGGALPYVYGYKYRQQTRFSFQVVKLVDGNTYVFDIRHGNTTNTILSAVVGAGRFIRMHEFQKRSHEGNNKLHPRSTFLPLEDRQHNLESLPKTGLPQVAGFSDYDSNIPRAFVTSSRDMQYYAESLTLLSNISEMCTKLNRAIENMKVSIGLKVAAELQPEGPQQ